MAWELILRNLRIIITIDTILKATHGPPTSRGCQVLVQSHSLAVKVTDFGLARQKLGSSTVQGLV